MGSSSTGNMTKAEKDRLQNIISDTLTLLCKNGLTSKFEREFCVEALIGITVDQGKDLMLISIKDTVKNPNPPPEIEDEGSDGGTAAVVSKKRKRKQRKSTDDDGASEPKTPRTDTDHGSHSRRNLFPGDDSRGSFSGQSYDYDMKQEHGDYDMAHIVKKEPGFSPMNSSGVSIQHIPQGMVMDPNMSQASLPPAQVGDLNEQVELMPGSGVYIKRATYNQLQFIDKGSKLVRKLVREIFPDVHLLASSSCMGKGESSAGLDRHKVEVIKGYSQMFCPDLNDVTIIQIINDLIRDVRRTLKRRGEYTGKPSRRKSRQAGTQLLSKETPEQDAYDAVANLDYNSIVLQTESIDEKLLVTLDLKSTFS